MLSYGISSSLLATALAAVAGEWNYDKLGADWGNDYEVCRNGREQSPVNLNSENLQSAALQKLEVSGYADKTYSVQLLTGTVQAQGVTTGSFTKTFWDGSTADFVPAQFHFHAPSEHTVDNKTYDLELHVVHTYTDGSLGGVIGVFFDRVAGGSSTNGFLTQVAPQLASANGTARGISFNSWLNSLDLSNAAFYSYDGSLTTPPCTEGIKWSVLQEVQPISAAQLSYFTNYWAGSASFANGNGNNRETQPWNSRFVVSNAPADIENLVAYTGAVSMVLSGLATATLLSQMI